MFIFNESEYLLDLPRSNNYDGLVNLIQAFIAHEVSRPVPEQTPMTAALEALLVELEASRWQAIMAETDRKKASEAFKKVENHAHALVRQAHNMIKATFKDEPVQAQTWGFTVRQTGRSAGRILLPQRRSELLLTLNVYIAAEQARPEEERFTLPALADMVTARNELIVYSKARKEHLRQRKEANRHARALCRETRKLLKEAAAYLVVTQCEGKICPDLEKWGFAVVNRGTTAVREPDPTPLEPTAEPA